MPTCLTCASLSGIAPITPATPVYDGALWRIEHAYPVGLIGWMVIILKRHCAALHELAPDEFRELGTLQYAATHALRDYLGCASEYLMLFAEKPGFQHVHVHVVPRMADLAPELLGPRITEYLRVAPEEAVPVEQIQSFALAMRPLVTAYIAENS